MRLVARQLDGKLALMEAEYSEREAEALVKAERHHTCDVMRELELTITEELKSLELGHAQVRGGAARLLKLL